MSDEQWQVITGDCAAVMRDRVADGAIDLTVTSPPYDNLRKYNGYHFDFEAIAAQLWRVTKPGGVVVWVVADATINGSETGTSFRQALHFMGLGFRLHDTMIYSTNKPPLNHNRYERQFEYTFVLSKGQVITFNPIMIPCDHAGGKQSPTFRHNGAGLHKMHKLNPIKGTKIKGNIWHYKGGTASGDDPLAFNHPASFPEALARDHIISWSNPGDVVLDPMCGSGTTGKQAVLLGRRFIGIDISAEYIEGIARPRIQAAAEQARQAELPLASRLDAARNHND